LIEDSRGIIGTSDNDDNEIYALEY
jgi:hypothetical protein